MAASVYLFGSSLITVLTMTLKHKLSKRLIYTVTNKSPFPDYVSLIKHTQLTFNMIPWCQLFSWTISRHKLERAEQIFYNSNAVFPTPFTADFLLRTLWSWMSDTHTSFISFYTCVHLSLEFFKKCTTKWGRKSACNLDW